MSENQNSSVVQTVTDKQVKEARARLWHMGIIEWKLDITQKKLYDFYKGNTNKTIVINCSRRLGKSYLLTILAIEQCLQKPKSIVKFLQPEVKMIRTNIRPVINEILDDCPRELRPQFKTQDSMYVFPNGSEIHLAGTDNGNHEKLRGGNADLALIDEAGFCSELEYIVNSILIPTTTLTQGRIILSSTTPPKPDHEFIKYMQHAEVDGRLIRKTIYDAVDDNKDQLKPRIHAGIVADIVKSMPLGEKDDAFRTEYLCVAKDTMIRTETGFKEIQDIQVGEKVYSHNGVLRKVNHVFKNKLDNRDVFKIKCSDNDGFIVTKGHKLFVTQKDRWNNILFEGFKAVEDIKLDWNSRYYFNNPIITNNLHESLDSDLSYLCGWFVAEGNCNKTQQQSYFALSKSDPINKLSHLCQKFFNKPLKEYGSDKNCKQYALNSKTAKTLFKQFGEGAPNKFIPDFIKKSSKESKIKFIKGLFEGDGCLHEGQTGNILALSTVSKKLAYDVSELLLSLGFTNSIHKTYRPKTCIIEGRIVNQKDNYSVRLTGDSYNRFCEIDKIVKKRHYIEDNRFFSKITKIEQIEYNEEYVWDIEVDVDHSYVSLHGTFHNCEVIYDSKSSVVPEFTDEIQKDTIVPWLRPAFYDRYTAMDIGFDDLTAILFAYWDFDNGVLVIEQEYDINGVEMTTRKVAEAINRIETELWTNRLTGEFEKPYKRIADNNLIMLNDLQKDHGLTFYATEKHNKDAYINAMRNMIAERQIIIHPRCKKLIQHLQLATWDKTRKDFKRSADNGHYDYVAALMYLVRNLDTTRNPYPKGYRHSKLGRSGDIFVNPYYKEEDSQDKFKKLFERKSSFTKKK